MQFEFQNTLEDYRRANAAQLYRRLLVHLLTSLVTRVYICYALLNLGMLLRGGPGLSWDDLRTRPALVLIGVATAGIWLFIKVFFVRHRVKSAWSKQPSEQVVQRWEVTDDGVTIDHGHTRAVRQWVAFARFKELPTMFLLNLSPFHFFMIPKRAFATSEQLTEFSDLLKRHIQPKSQAFPVVLSANGQGNPVNT